MGLLDDFGELLLELELNPFGEGLVAIVGRAVVNGGMVDALFLGIVARKTGDNRYVAESD